MGGFNAANATLCDVHVTALASRAHMLGPLALGVSSQLFLIHNAKSSIFLCTVCCVPAGV
jgi:hypothetical protein